MKNGNIVHDRSTQLFVTIPRHRVPDLLKMAKCWARVLRQESLYVEISQPDTVLFVEPDRYLIPKTPPSGLVAPPPRPMTFSRHSPSPIPPLDCCDPGEENPTPVSDPSHWHSWIERVEEENRQEQIENLESSLSAISVSFLESICADIRKHGSVEVPGELSVGVVRLLRDKGFIAKVYSHKGTIATVVKHEKENPESSLSPTEAFSLRSIRTDIENHGSSEVSWELSTTLIQRLEAEGFAVFPKTVVRREEEKETP